MGRNAALLVFLIGIVAALIAIAKLGPGPADVPPARAEEDRTLGDPRAPIVLIEYAAPQCPHCAAFNVEGFPALRRDYVATRKVFFIFRVYPIGPADFPAEALARCLPADKYFAFIDLLYRNQAKWDPENGVHDVQGGLRALALSAGLDEDRSTACMADADERARIAAVANDAASRFGISGTPTFVINGKVQKAGLPWPAIKAKLDSLLAGSPAIHAWDGAGH